MKFCGECGVATVRQIPPGDDHMRDVCEACGTIHYKNPKVIVGTLPVYEGRVLLCKRAIEPRYGYWTLPAGFLEMGESTWVGAKRETYEEAGAIVEEGQLYGVFDLPHISQIYMFYLSQVIDGKFRAGSESLEVAWFDERDIPWGELAFSVVDARLKRSFIDRRRNEFPLCQEILSPHREAWRGSSS